jgi:hypothetical protein
MFRLGSHHRSDARPREHVGWQAPEGFPPPDVGGSKANEEEDRRETVRGGGSERRKKRAEKNISLTSGSHVSDGLPQRLYPAQHATCTKPPSKTLFFAKLSKCFAKLNVFNIRFFNSDDVVRPR